MTRFLGTGLYCPNCQAELNSDVETTDGTTILRETLFCRCGHEEPVVQAPAWTVEDVRRRIAIVRSRAMSETKARQIVYARSGGICERCSQARGAEWQHRQNRSQGGVWSPENGLHCCSPCHRYITGHPTDSDVHGWTVKRDDDPALRPVLIQNGSRWVYLTPSGEYSDEPPMEAA